VPPFSFGKISNPPWFSSPVCFHQVLAVNINHHLDYVCSSTSTQMSLDQSASSSPSSAPMFGKRHSEMSTTSSTPHMIKRTAHDAGPLPDIHHGKRAKAASNLRAAAPLAERLRPNSLAEFVGQQHLTGANSLLIRTLKMGSIGSIIFWGPPGFVLVVSIDFGADFSSKLWEDNPCTAFGKAIRYNL